MTDDTTNHTAKLNRETMSVKEHRRYLANLRRAQLAAEQKEAA